MKNKLSEKMELFIINLESRQLLENFFIAAIAAIITVRVSLLLTDYPQLGGEVLHIAHMLWGGVFMLVATMTLLLFLSREAKEFSSIAGGIGFGLFIDELGKFITRDNDYFYQPAIALIYLVIISLFLLTRLIEKSAKPTEKTYVINGLEIMKEVMLFDLDYHEKRKALKYLKKGGNESFVKRLIATLEKVETQKTIERNVFSRVKHFIEEKYETVASNKLFVKLIVIAFIVQSLLNFLPPIINYREVESVWEYGEVISSAVSFMMVIFASVVFVQGRRMLGFELFKYAALISIFITQFFLFYQDQLSAIIFLAISITLYTAIRFFIAQENKEKKKSGLLHKLTTILGASQ